MSVRIKPGYGFVHQCVMANPNITVQARCLYALIQSYSGSTGKCWPSIATLAKQMACDERTIQRWMIELETAMLLQVDRRPGFTNIYHPLVPEDTPDTGATPTPDIRDGGRRHPGHPSPDTGATQTVSLNSNKNISRESPPPGGGAAPETVPALDADSEFGKWFHRRRGKEG